jgi:hypothetical protein
MPEGTEGLSAHDLAMAAKVDQLHASFQPAKEPATPPASQPVARPEHIPEKFWDAEKGVAKVDEMAKSYAELERGKAAPAAPPADPAAQAAAEAAKAAGAAGAGVDFTSFTNEFATNGKLGDESYAALEAKGIPKAVVDEFIASKQAAAEAATQVATSEAFELAGGKDAYSSMLNWAAVNLSPADAAAFDTAVVGDSASRKQAITSLKAQYSKAFGTPPKLVNGDGAAVNAEAFQSRAEVTAAMRDPRYKADAAYRATVERRIGAMPVF